MSGKLLVLLAGVAILAAGGCKKQPAVTESKKEAAPAKLDACALITREEIQSIQGSPLKETKGTHRSEGAFHVSQCVFVAEEFVKSVSLMVTQRNPDGEGARTPKNLWQETFGRYEKGEEETSEKGEQEGEGKKKKSPPRKIDGLGDAAYWSSGLISVLHVLKNDTIVYLSLGGADNDETKFNKSRALAEKLLARL